ncbi:hypothetical protein C8F01DRAFT_1246741 [Mycena amicta]|nr:hypothetical protein C8F01DRAFT_1246741 [Mycena amicta]
MSSANRYRAVLRELRASAVAPNPAIAASFRSLIAARTDIENALIFMRSQRVYNARIPRLNLVHSHPVQELLERYNPTINYTADERIKLNRPPLCLPSESDHV